MSITQSSSKRLEGRHVLFALMGFFGVMLIANGFFLYFAIGTFNGFETDGAYKKGLTYNERISIDAEQSKRGWTSQFQYAEKKLFLEINDKQGSGVAGLVLEGEVRRPATDRADTAIKLIERSPGRYAADIELAPGQWIVSARAGKPEFRVKQRIHVRAQP